MRRSALVLSVLGLGGGLAVAYQPPPGYWKPGITFSASAVAFAPDGRVAVAQDAAANDASISVYSSLADIGGTPLATFTDPHWMSFGGVKFADNDTIVFLDQGSVYGGTGDAYKASIATAQVAPLAPAKSIMNGSGLTIVGSSVYIVDAGHNISDDGNRLVRVSLSSDGTAAPTALLTNFGAGYGGAVLTDKDGNFLLTDNNNLAAGKILRYSPVLAPLASIDLASGGGYGAVDMIYDSEGDILVTTGSTLTRIPAGSTAAEPFGSFTGSFPWPTYLAYEGHSFQSGAGDGTLLVSGWTEENFGGAFAIAVPEPTSLGLIVFAPFLLLRRRR